MADGERQYDALEQRLAQAPVIQRADDHHGRRCERRGASGAGGLRQAVRGQYAHRLITGGIGHNLPQEAPREFAQAVIDVDAA